MIWAVLLLLGVVAAVHWFDYRRCVEEYTFAQPGAVGDVTAALLNDKTPIVVEVGQLPWRPEVADVASWVVEVEGGTQLPVSAWRRGGIDVSAGGSSAGEITNGTALAGEMGLLTGLGEFDGARPLWWIPGFSGAEVGILAPNETLGLSWISAERRWIGCSAGAPIVLWLAHTRYRRFLPEGGEGPVDPWRLTVAEAPWIGRVQFVEVRVRPGWCVGLPAHWGYAVRTEASGAADASWWWSADQHSPLSWALESIR
jgi:hypothetical protein